MESAGVSESSAGIGEGKLKDADWEDGVGGIWM